MKIPNSDRYEEQNFAANMAWSIDDISIVPTDQLAALRFPDYYINSST